MSTRQVGRPQDPAISEALLREAERIMTTEGFSGLTVERICSDIGSTRPAFYRRYRNAAHLAFDVVRRHFGAEPPAATGSLEGDLMALQLAEVAMFSDPLMSKNLSGLLESALADPTLADTYAGQFILPRRARVVDVLDAAVARGEIAGYDDVPFLCDLLVGPFLSRALLPGSEPIDDTLARSTTRAVLATLGALAPAA
ncbi:TetR-like C-terminal domain-containing protein [Luteimicrobium sp. DT211]|uniref:TetR-like C-terminal domain-containing protein n=1 Tax=Luteimicrobium sp. DT211 TaxID=3393412 RepID=UPI003CF4AA98